MAKKSSKKGRAAASARPEMAKPSETIVLTPEGTLRNLLKQDDHYRDTIRSLTGELRETIGNAVDKKHLNKKAYAMLKAMRQITPIEARRDAYYTFLRYFEMSGELARIEQVPRLDLDDDSNDRITEADLQETKANGKPKAKPRAKAKASTPEPVEDYGGPIELTGDENSAQFPRAVN